ncbi:DUF3795 domain-containing protein [Anaerosporobacter faecicola]|uniref:DUF3795 domain-containing protein n=1 Tax=Anaerosporobacter faecicola TaxID=2718714 RepID=UPI00143A5D5A|nr:DUF3795 domain-containing protein [Anaerosporobacter faecicola]
MKIETYCGLSKGECKQDCDSSCKVAECARKNGKRFCGECPDFPCEILEEVSQNSEDNGRRIENCKVIKATLVREAREGIDPVSVCGHHCDYCFMGQWCGGCRSSYNCCSFATISPDGVCPNVSCANEKGYDGCYDCDQIDDCVKGYYSISNEFVAKATAKFIHQYGKEAYTRTLKRAIDSGENYQKSFDSTGSVDGALRLLEKYR